MLDAFHKPVYYLVDRKIKEEWPFIHPEHPYYKPKQQYKNISIFPPLTVWRCKTPEVCSV